MLHINMFVIGCPHDHLDGLSPGSDSSSLTTDENGMPVRRSVKGTKQVCPAPGKQPMVNWAELLPPPPEHPPPSEMGSPTDSPMNSLQRHHHHLQDGQRFAENRSPISPVSKISACSCPVPHESLVQTVRGLPCYSDTEYTGGPPHGQRYPDYRPYSPKQFSMRTQPPLAMMPSGGGGGGRLGPGGPGLRVCHTCPPNAYMGGGVEGFACPHVHSYHSDLEHFGQHAGMGGSGGAYNVSGAPASLHGYRMPPLDGSLTGGDPIQIHMYNQGQGSMGNEALMDRACQSSLPSLANDSSGYRSSR